MCNTIGEQDAFTAMTSNSFTLQPVHHDVGRMGRHSSRVSLPGVPYVNVGKCESITKTVVLGVQKVEASDSFGMSYLLTSVPAVFLTSFMKR